jgi:hypothetical protein
MSEHEAQLGSDADFSASRQLAAELAELQLNSVPTPEAATQSTEILRLHIPEAVIFGKTELAFIAQIRAAAGESAKQYGLDPAHEGTQSDSQDRIDYILATSQATLESRLAMSSANTAGFSTDLQVSGNKQASKRRWRQPEPSPAQVIGKLNIHQYEAFLYAHIERMETVIDARSQEIMEMESSFNDRLGTAIDAGVVPLSRREAAQRLEHTKIVIVDPWAKDPSWTQESGGHYDQASDTIRLFNPYQPPQQLQEDIDHESFHALSATQTAGMYKGGLAISEAPEGSDATPVSRLDWLNEAVTERLAIEIRQHKTGVYVHDRMIVDQFTDRVPAAQFYKAYFDPVERDGTVPSFIALQDGLNKAFEPGILGTVDDLISGQSDHSGGPSYDQAQRYLAAIA